MHLTNYSINVNSEKFIHTEELFEKNDGSKQTFTSVLKNLKDLNFDTNEIKKSISDAV